ncbi:DUF664 domain-containing protein [Streptomyces sp. RK75]|nr:DUF664 domain-containing protein [Streptomyces sp. RK75]
MNDDQRIPPSKVADDRASLTSFLDHQRATLAMKCQGLTGAQLKRRAIPTSQLTLLGLVRHAASVERSWFRFALNAEDVGPLWPGEVDGTAGYCRGQVADGVAFRRRAECWLLDRPCRCSCVLRRRSGAHRRPRTT